MDRRKFLTTTGALATGLVLGGPSTAFAGERRLSRIGIQLYTVRARMAENVAATLAKVASFGYDEVEFAGYYDHSPQEISEMLADTGLTAPSAHVPLDIFEGDFDAFLEKAHVIGHKYVILPWLQEKDRTLDRYKAVAETLNKAGEKAKSAGMEVGYHNHDFEFEAIDGVEPFEILLTETDPELVKIQLDLYWVAVGKRDPLDYINRYPGRFPSVHVKDMDSTGKMTDVGEGIIDFGRVFPGSGKSRAEALFL